MKGIIALLLFLVFGININAQNFDAEIITLEEDLELLKSKQLAVLDKIEVVRLNKIIAELKAVGLPSDNFIEHAAMCLEYSEEHEQAKWVAHIILPQIIDGVVSRTNVFMEDDKIPSGSAVEEDYFLKFPKDDGSFDYDGFGYDRGHIAPSADFKWSATALSESYFYSNMSPQLPEFNREGWADLESFLRGYIYANPESQLYVVTGPILEEGLPVVERSINKVSIPKYYFKVAIDLEKMEGIGFVLPNQKIRYPLENFSKTIDEVEEMVGLDFFNKLPISKQESIESTFDKKIWFRDVARGDVEPFYPPSLPKGHFNTTQSKLYVDSGDRIAVCGTVVSTKVSRKGHLWMNLDKNSPNQVFSIFISKEDLVNFGFNPEKELLNQEVCVKGKVNNFNGIPNMKISREGDIQLYKE